MIRSQTLKGKAAGSGRRSGNSGRRTERLRIMQIENRDNSITISSYVQSSFQNRPNKRKPKFKPGSSEHTLQLINRSINNKRVIKYFDTMLTLNDASTSVGYELLSVVPQGVAQQQRIADTLWIHRLDIRGNVTLTVNVSNLATVRIGFFIWWQNTASVGPASTSIYESPAIFGPWSPLNFEGREYYSMLKDFQISLAGSTGTPTLLMNRQFIETITFQNSHRVDFQPVGTTTGTGHLYFVNYSDTILANAPVYNLQTRLWYSDD
jgi:hypothetical protein